MEESERRAWCYFMHGFLLAKYGAPWPEKSRAALFGPERGSLDGLLGSLAEITRELDRRYGDGWTFTKVAAELPEALGFFQRLQQESAGDSTAG